MPEPYETRVRYYGAYATRRRLWWRRRGVVPEGTRGDAASAAAPCNGPELISEAFMAWCGEQGIEVRHIQPGKPDQNAFVERFNRSYRREVLDAYVFESIDEVQRATDEWLDDYNRERPHDGLGRVPPLTFMPRPDDPPESSYQLST